MEKFYKIVMGMHEHPQSYQERGYKAPKGSTADDHQLLYPGDIVRVEEGLILRPPAMGGWADPQKNGMWVITCAAEVPGAVEESFVLRDEPSRIAGINISETSLKRLERVEEETESVTIPRMPVARDAPRSVRR